MKLPRYGDLEYITSTILSDGFSLVSGSLGTALKTLYSAGVINGDEGLTVTTSSSLNVQITATGNFLLLFGDGSTAEILGTADGASTNSYTFDFSTQPSGWVSGGNIYAIAALQSIQEDPLAVSGPPPGHPDYDPNFSPYTLYTQAWDSLAFSLSATPADGVTQIGLFHVTFTTGQTSITDGDINYSSRTIAVPQLTTVRIVSSTSDATSWPQGLAVGNMTSGLGYPANYGHVLSLGVGTSLSGGYTQLYQEWPSTSGGATSLWARATMDGDSVFGAWQQVIMTPQGSNDITMPGGVTVPSGSIFSGDGSGLTNLDVTSVSGSNITDIVVGSGLTITNPTGGGTTTIDLALTQAIIDTALGYTPLNKAGDTMSGALNMGGYGISNIASLSIASSALAGPLLSGITGGTGVTVTGNPSSGTGSPTISIASAPNSALSGPLVDALTGGTNISVSNPSGVGSATVNVSPQGSGSGLNADMVDGYHSSSFLTTAGGWTISGAGVVFDVAIQTNGVVPYAGIQASYTINSGATYTIPQGLFFAVPSGGALELHTVVGGTDYWASGWEGGAIIGDANANRYFKNTNVGAVTLVMTYY